MKIALVCPYDLAYPGGVGNHISALDNQFTKMGHDVRVISPASKNIPALGDRLIRIGKPWPYPSSGSVARVSLTPWLSLQVKSVLEREKFDIIHLHEPLCPMLCTTVLRLSDTVNVGTFHAVDSRSLSLGKPFMGIYLKKWFRKLDGKIAVSKPAMEFAKRHFPAEYLVIPNGVDLEHFSPKVPPIEEFGDGKINVVFVGRLEKRKGVNYLLSAYQRLKKEVGHCRLILVGPSTRWSRKYEKRVGEGSPADIVFTGYASYADLPRYYQTADIVCSPATGKESFGLVLLEAMAMGKPIVASNINGYASVVTHGVEGLLVPARDERRLAEALILLASDARRRQELGARGRAKALDYGWKNIARRVADYYTTIRNGRSATSIT
jgi:phosphatidylinositol alpha-mannosyltransferase